MIPPDLASPVIGMAGMDVNRRAERAPTRPCGPGPPVPGQAPGLAGCFPATIRAGPAESRGAVGRQTGNARRIIGKGAGQWVAVALVDELAHGPDELRVQVPAAHAVQPPGTAGQHVGCVAHQREPPVLAADRERHYAQSQQDGQEESGCYYDYETGHDGLQHFRPASHPRGPTRCDLVRRVLAGLVLAGHDVPVCPRSVRPVR